MISYLNLGTGTYTYIGVFLGLFYIPRGGNFLIFLHKDLLFLLIYIDFLIIILSLYFFFAFMLYLEFPMFISSGIPCIIFTMQTPKDYRRTRASLICKPAPSLKIMHECSVTYSYSTTRSNSQCIDLRVRAIRSVLFCAFTSFCTC
jgi:hypothetical protein